MSPSRISISAPTPLLAIRRMSQVKLTEHPLPKDMVSHIEGSSASHECLTGQ